MNAPYLLRLLCLSFASFFLVYLALALLSIAATPAVIRVAKRTTPLAATRLLLFARLFPLGLSLLVVLGLCLPSYLLLEPEASAERVGLACLLAALAGALAWAISIVRAVRASARSLEYLRRCRGLGADLRLAGEPLPLCLLEGETPVLALAGVVRPRIVLSRAVLRSLSAEQLETALSHERAHSVSHDNLKRLLLLLAPDPIPFVHGLSALDRQWAKYAEWAADDRAVAGDTRRSLSLASALVRIARLGSPARIAPLMASLLAADDELSARVDRLLRSGSAGASSRSPRRAALAAAAMAAAFSLLLAVMLQPATLSSVHHILEHLIR
ncbi:MAG: M48 family metalloprotease [Acidobacteriota bacterium]|nr:M48 family metalloprotease [Acidobacteriota bacterium]